MFLAGSWTDNEIIIFIKIINYFFPASGPLHQYIIGFFQ